MSSALAYVRWLTEAHRSVIGVDKAEHLDKLFNTIEESDKTANEIYDLMGTECSSDDSPFENAVISVLNCLSAKCMLKIVRSIFSKTLKTFKLIRSTVFSAI